MTESVVMWHDSPLGRILLASAGDALAGAWFEGQRHFGAGLSQDCVERAGHPVLRAAAAWFDAYFAGERPDPAAIALAWPQNEFRRAVWECLLEIPYGARRSYSDVAAAAAGRLKRKTCPRAAGAAIARNPFSIIVPCHRVVGKNGDLTGYAGGLERKRRLLAMEGGEA